MAKNEADSATSAPELNGPSRKPVWRGLIVPAVLMLAVVIVLVILGNWQMSRLTWKEVLIASVDSRFDASATAPPGPDRWVGLTVEDVNYLHVEMRGRYLAGEAHVYTVLNGARGAFNGPGYWVASPFQTADGWFVFVNRGFVPDAQKDAASRPGSDAPAGTVTIDGTIRRAEPAQTFTPKTNTAKNVWFVRDPAELARAFGLDAARVAPYTVDLRATHATPGGLPQPGETKVSFNNPHLGYALTWYGVALAAFGVFAAFAAGRLKRLR